MMLSCKQHIVERLVILQLGSNNACVQKDFWDNFVSLVRLAIDIVWPMEDPSCVASHATVTNTPRSVTLRQDVVFVSIIQPEILVINVLVVTMEMR
jgi:hypothetical protein